MVVRVSSSSAPVFEMARQRADQRHDVLADQRLAAGEPELAHAAGDEGRAEPVELLERQHVLLRQEGHVLRHAIDAAEVAAVGHRHAQIGDRPAERVDQRLRMGRRRGSAPCRCGRQAISPILAERGRGSKAGLPAAARRPYADRRAARSRRLSEKQPWPTEIRLRQGPPVAYRPIRRRHRLRSAGRDAARPQPLGGGPGPQPGTASDGAAARSTSAIAAVDPVGNYAVRLTFSDGHNTGLFSWTYLRHLGEEREPLWGGYLADLKPKG